MYKTTSIHYDSFLSIAAQCAQNGQIWKKITISRSQNRKITPFPPMDPPEGGPIGGIRGFARMREDGPEIARRADRVGVLPHAPLVGNLPECAQEG